MLLPPSTASMYEQLLNLENYELSKKPNISWERIMEIRHLKDRMCRKCQKLAKTTMPIARTSSRGDSFVFQTFVAPPDFRVKEMEKWFRDQQKRGTTTLPRKAIAPNASSTQDYSMAGPSSSRPVPPPSTKQPIRRSITNPETSTNLKQTLFYKPLPVQPSRLVQPEQRFSLASAPPPPGLADIMSPPPLPVLLLSQRESYGLEADDLQPEPPADNIPIPAPITEAGPSEPAPEPSLRPSLSRRNSNIKRNSMVELKTVSWADNNELDNQFSKYASAAREAQASGENVLESIFGLSITLF